LVIIIVYYAEAVQKRCTKQHNIQKKDSENKNSCTLYQIIYNTIPVEIKILIDILTNPSYFINSQVRTKLCNKHN